MTKKKFPLIIEILEIFLQNFGGQRLNIFMRNNGQIKMKINFAVNGKFRIVCVCVFVAVVVVNITSLTCFFWQPFFPREITILQSYHYYYHQHRGH